MLRRVFPAMILSILLILVAACSPLDSLERYRTGLLETCVQTESYLDLAVKADSIDDALSYAEIARHYIEEALTIELPEDVDSNLRSAHAALFTQIEALDSWLAGLNTDFDSTLGAKHLKDLRAVRQELFLVLDDLDVQ